MIGLNDKFGFGFRHDTRLKAALSGNSSTLPTSLQPPNLK